MFEPAGRVFGFAVKRALEWSKIIFSEWNGFWATARQATMTVFFQNFKGTDGGKGK